MLLLFQLAIVEALPFSFSVVLVEVLEFRLAVVSAVISISATRSCSANHSLIVPLFTESSISATGSCATTTNATNATSPTTTSITTSGRASIGSLNL
ncbi:hypothetical protein HPDP_00441 [Candidatus Hepatincola sp. Pdp]